MGCGWLDFSFFYLSLLGRAGFGSLHNPESSSRHPSSGGSCLSANTDQRFFNAPCFDFSQTSF